MSLTCDCCDSSKSELFARKSLVLPGTNYKMCRTCIENKLEPRWSIILAGRSFGHERVRKLILNHQYIGPEISYAEIIKK